MWTDMMTAAEILRESQKTAITGMQSAFRKTEKILPHKGWWR
jgi:hypothetical protein